MITPDVFWGGTVVIIVLLVIGYIWLKKHNAAAAATVSSDVQTAGRDIVAEFDKLKAWLESKFESAPPASTAPPPAAPAPAAAVAMAHQAARPATAVAAAPTGAAPMSAVPFTQYELAWPTNPSGGNTVDDTHSIPAGGVVVWHIKTPATYKSGTVYLSEYGSPPTPRQGALNKTPGDLYTQIGPANASGAFSGDTNPNVPFRMALPSGKHVDPSNYMIVGPNTDLYLNVENVNESASGQVIVTLAVANS